MGKEEKCQEIVELDEMTTEEIIQWFRDIYAKHGSEFRPIAVVHDDLIVEVGCEE